MDPALLARLCPEYRDALVFPAVRDFRNKVQQKLQGVQPGPTPSAADVGLLRSGRQWYDANGRQAWLMQQPPERLEGRFVYLGSLHDHFGHMLTESVNRLWAWRYLRDSVDGAIWLPYRKGAEWSMATRIIANAFGLDPSCVVEVTRPTAVTRLFVPEPGAALDTPAQPWYRNELAHAFPLADYIQPGRPTAIVVTRRRYRLQGRVAGFDAVINAATASGYREIMPESLTLTEQLVTIASAKSILWEEGSACHIAELLPEIPARSLVVSRGRRTKAVVTSLAAKSPTVDYARVIPQQGISPEAALMSRLPDPDDLRDAITRAGLPPVVPIDTSAFRQMEREDLLAWSMNWGRQSEHIAQWLPEACSSATGPTVINVAPTPESGHFVWHLDEPMPINSQVGAAAWHIAGWVALPNLGYDDGLWLDSPQGRIPVLGRPVPPQVAVRMSGVPRRLHRAVGRFTLLVPTCWERITLGVALSCNDIPLARITLAPLP